MKTKIAGLIQSKISRSSFLRRILLVFGVGTFMEGCKKEEIPEKEEEIPGNGDLTKVYLVQNGTVKENINKLLELIGGISKYIDPSDVVVLKCNGQWPNQGYTNTECIKYVIDAILAIPGFSGEILICDDIQFIPDSTTGFLASPDNRVNNWPDHNWNSLAAVFKSKGFPVATFSWEAKPIVINITGPGDGTGWVSSFFDFHGLRAYFSYPIFESPLNPGRLIDMKNGVWENGAFSGRKVKAIFMPTLNNHGRNYQEDYAGITSAIKSFFGTTEIHSGEDATILYQGIKYHHMHSASYTKRNAEHAGELTARYMQTMYKPVLFITCAIWSGIESRIGEARNTKAVLACENPSTLDYVSCKKVISKHAPWLDPDKNNNTRKQILGCVNNGIGTINEDEIKIINYEF
jgi:hypothetical protein